MKPKSITTKNGETKKFKAAGSWLFHKATESTGLDNFKRTGFYLTGKKSSLSWSQNPASTFTWLMETS